MSDQGGCVLELVTVPVFRGGKQLIRPVSFSLTAGRYLELQGDNGSGKTSLLRTIAGLQSAPSGHAAGEIRRRDEQGFFYFGHQSGFRSELEVAQQLRLSLALYGAPADNATLKALLQRVGLLHHASSRVRQLSQGQIRRLMLAIMSSSGRTIWLIDEPLNALDVHAISLFGEILREHFNRGGAAVVATHRPLDEAIPELAVHALGKLHLEHNAATFRPLGKQSNESAGSPSAAEPANGNRLAIGWILRREFALAAARPQDLAWPSIFHWMVITMFPFGLGSETELLARAAGGVFWVSALLASLIAANRFFEADFEHGVISELHIAGVSLPMVALGKVLSGWLFVGLPLSLASLPLGLFYSLPGEVLLVLFLSLAAGAVSLAAFGSLFAALGLMARQAQVIICLLALPVFVPLVVFGTAAISGAQTGIGYTSPLVVLLSLALLSVVGLPMVTGRVLALAIE